MLRVLQDGLVDRVGGTKPVPVDVRVIAATNADLPAAIRDGRFRSDLYYRLNVFPIHMPPLRERPEDIPILARHFLRVHAQRLKRSCEDFDASAMERLVRYAWPGNVRELENIVERGLILCQERLLSLDSLMMSSPASPESSARRTLQDEERHHILRALTLLDWRIEGSGGAAEQLGLAPSTLRSRLNKLGIRRPSRT